MQNIHSSPHRLPIPKLPHRLVMLAWSLLKKTTGEMPLMKLRAFFGSGNPVFCNYHPILTGIPCGINAQPLPRSTPPQPPEPKSPDDWFPYSSQLGFELADFLYTQNQMPADHINTLLDMWAASLVEAGGQPKLLFTCHKDLYSTIDRTCLGDVKWQNFSIKYSHNLNEPAPWMQAQFDVWFRCPLETICNMLSNPDLLPRWIIDLTMNMTRRVANVAFKTSCLVTGHGIRLVSKDVIANDHPECKGSTFVPIILGSDKTTVSVATGQHDYYPLYLSVGNIHNSMRHAHRHGVSLIAFLAVPKTTREFAQTAPFCKFHRQLFHVSLSRILSILKPYMTRPDHVRFGDHHYHWVVYGLGPYIANYEEQALLACIVRNWCARCLATQGNLDGDALNRSREHANTLIAEFNLLDLWDEYGIVGDIITFVYADIDIHQQISQPLYSAVQRCTAATVPQQGPPLSSYPTVQ
ncbi:hypothetical protein BKA83DRAFT_4476196 [Pisolithus microcarpus]|nr:hypothetical protein BKA83DRAFT_4476196 [Pisolithus microcarpus]